MLLFYSRNPEQALKLKTYCEEKSINLRAQALILFEANNFIIDNLAYDVVFFSSPRSVDFSLNALLDKSQPKLACIGAQTKLHLENLGHSVSFFGSNNSEPSLVADEFKTWLGNKKVLFPISDQSKQSISKVLPQKQCVEVVVYRTLENPIHVLPNPNIVVLSSPSNAAAYLRLNKISSRQLIYCFGRTTQNYLKEQGLRAEILNSPTEEGVIEMLKNKFETLHNQ